MEWPECTSPRSERRAPLVAPPRPERYRRPRHDGVRGVTAAASDRCRLRRGGEGDLDEKFMDRCPDVCGGRRLPFLSEARARLAAESKPSPGPGGHMAAASVSAANSAARMGSISAKLRNGRPRAGAWRGWGAVCSTVYRAQEEECEAGQCFQRHLRRAGGPEGTTWRGGVRVSSSWPGGAVRRRAHDRCVSEPPPLPVFAVCVCVCGSRPKIGRLGRMKPYHTRSLEQMENNNKTNFKSVLRGACV